MTTIYSRCLHMTNPNLDNKPLYYSTYSFVAQVNGKPMEFVSEKEYEEYIAQEKPIEIIKKYFVDRKHVNFREKIVFYRRKFDNLYFVYRVSQYFRRKPEKEVYTFKDYWEAFGKYQELGGK